jgi:two-component system sensor histidine kinase TorS
MLDVSKLETGALQLAMEDDVRLEPVLHQVRNTAEGLVAHKPVRIELDVADPLPPLRCDQRRIHQAILNLVSNACQYTQRGHVRIRARRELDELLVEVEDTGPGIGFEDQARIFEAFRQDRPELEVGTGPGLGLPIASHLARAHRGRLWLKSAPGYGSTFYLALPLDQVDA